MTGKDPGGCIGEICMIYDMILVHSLSSFPATSHLNLSVLSSQLSALSSQLCPLPSPSQALYSSLLSVYCTHAAM